MDRLACLYDDGAYYSGNFIDNKKNGFGREFFSDGSEYSGNWKDSKPHGKGNLKYPDSTWFTGIFKNGKNHIQNGKGCRDQKLIGAQGARSKRRHK